MTADTLVGYEWARNAKAFHAVATLHRAIDALVYHGDQWERGESALALDDATALLRTRIALIEAECGF